MTDDKRKPLFALKRIPTPEEVREWAREAARRANEKKAAQGVAGWQVGGPWRH